MPVADETQFEATPHTRLNILDAYDGDDDDITAQLRRRGSTDLSEELAGSLVNDVEGVPGGGILGESGLMIEKVLCGISCKRIPRWVRRKIQSAQLTVKTWAYLISLGILTAAMGWALDVMYTTVRNGRLQIATMTFWSAYPLQMIWGVFWTCLAVLCCKKLSVYAKGSGTPEMKTILAGTMLLGPLSTRCFIAKIVGLVCGLGAGLSIGKEGPFIHMSCILGYQLTALPYFSSLRKNDRLLRQLLAAAVSAGITAAFGAPIGGVLFGIEVTVTYYMVNNMWRSYLCAVVCIIVAKIFDITNEKENFEPTSFSGDRFGWDMLLYVILGVLCGIGGASFVHMVSKFQKVFNYTFKHVSAYITSSLVILATVACFYPLPFMLYDDIQTSNQLFRAESLADSGYTWWTTPSIFLTLPVFVILKLVFTAAAVSLPLPCGLYLPMFVMGAGLGRFYGELLNVAFPHAGFLPGGYAVVAAAAFVGGGTHTVSTAVIAFELTGQLTHMIPVLTGVLVARAVAPAFAVPIYDLLMSIKSLPYLAAAKLSLLADRSAGDLLEDDPKYLTFKSTYLDAYDLLMTTAGKPSYEEIAVIDQDTKMLVASTTRRSLVKAIDNYAVEALNIASNDSGKSDGEFSSMMSGSTTDRRISDRDRQNASSIRENLHKMRHGIAKYLSEYFSPETYQLLSYEVISPTHVDPSNEALRGLFNEQMIFSPSYIGPESTTVKIDPAPMSIPVATPLTKVHFIFTITHWTVLFVTEKGKYKGVIGKNDIARESSRHDHEDNVVAPATPNSPTGTFMHDH